MRIHLSGPSLAFALTGALFVGLPATGVAQVVNPTIAEFTPSPDHSRLASDGTAWVTRYDLGFYQQGATSPFQVASLGKPAPQSDGQIRINLSTLTLPSAGIVYEARVTAVGPGGSTPSAVSNTFMFAAPCTYAVTPTTHSIGAGAWSGWVDVTAGATCQWTAVANQTLWLEVNGGAPSTNGTGSARVSIGAIANTSTAERTGTFTIAGQTVTVTQAPSVSCTYTVSPTSHAASASGGSSSVEVIAPSGCAWSASSNAAWLTIAAGSPGSGRGLLSFAVAANPLTTSRTGTLSVAGGIVTVTQAAATCGYVVTPTSHTIAVGGGTALGSVTTTAGCGWTTGNTASWLTVSSGRSGTGDYTLTATPNTSTSPRSAVLTVAGTSVSVTQSAAAACQVSVSSSSLTFDASGTNSASVDVTAGTGCAWTVSSSAPWLVIRTNQSGSGNARVTFRVDANETGASRTATLTIGGRQVTILQEAVNLPKGPKGIRILSTR
jgi:hypothetical protein